MFGNGLEGLMGFLMSGNGMHEWFFGFWSLVAIQGVCDSVGEAEEKNGVSAGMAGRTQETVETDRLTPEAAQA